MLLNIVGPMLAASPDHALRLLTVSGTVAWDDAWAAAIGDRVYATSFHNGYLTQPADHLVTEEAVTACAVRPKGDFMASVRTLRTELDATGKNIMISADEWGLGPPWRVKRFGVPHGMYAAGFLSAVTRGSPVYNLTFTNYFEPVNEGAISVYLSGANLTAVGQVMGVYSQHSGRTRVTLPAVSYVNNPARPFMLHWGNIRRCVLDRRYAGTV